MREMGRGERKELLARPRTLDVLVAGGEKKNEAETDREEVGSTHFWFLVCLYFSFYPC